MKLVLLYGSENWILADALIRHQEAFQAGQESADVVQTSLEHCCCCCSGCAYDEMQNSGEEALVSDESDGR